LVWLESPTTRSWLLQSAAEAESWLLQSAAEAESWLQQSATTPLS
jgi:hypothetical protein